MSATKLLPGVGFILGCASGIGRATAEAFARAGVRGLVLADVNQAGMKETASIISKEFPSLDPVTLPVNLGDEKSCLDCVRDAAKAYGRIDYVLNNVGIGYNNSPSTHLDKAEFLKVIDINMIGLWVCQKEQIKQMLTQDTLELPSGRGNRGVITNTASILGLVGEPSAAAYTASKHAIIGLTKADAAAFGMHGVRINALCPGYVVTPLLGNNDPAARDAIVAAMTPRVPIGRLGLVEEIADAAVFLSSHMSSYMYGSSLVVDGGYTSV